MKLLNRFLVLLLASSLIAGPANAGPEEEARAHVKASQEAARDKARLVFQQYLQEAAVQASHVIDYSDTFNQASQDLAGQMQDLEKSRLQLAQAVERTDSALAPGALDHVSNQLEAIYESTSNLYVAARVAEKKRDYSILDNAKSHGEIEGALQEFLRNIQTTCDNGIAANFEFPDLPSIRPIVPTYSFGAQASFGGGNGPIPAPQIPSVQTPGLHGQAATAVYTGVYAGGFVLGAYLVTGKVILTTAAAQTLTAASMLAATGIGLAAAAVVALVVYFDGLFSAISQSHQISNAMWISHNEKADGETVRAEFKKICKPFAERAKLVLPRLQAIAKNDPQAIADYQADRDQITTGAAELMALQKDVNDEMAKIQLELESDPNAAKLTDAQRQAILKQRLDASPAIPKMRKHLQELTTDHLMKFFEVALMNIGTHAEEVEKELKVQYQALFKNQTDQHLEKIMQLAQLARRLAVPDSVRQMVAAELKANARISGLFREFDAAFAGFVQDELNFGQDQAFRARLAQWLEHVKAARAELQTSPTLKVLVQRGEDFLKFLNADVK